jgi:hypothetical protein
VPLGGSPATSSRRLFLLLGFCLGFNFDFLVRLDFGLLIALLFSFSFSFSFSFLLDLHRFRLRF